MAEEVEPGWEDRWREFHRPVRAGPFWIGPPWEPPPPDALAVVIDPGRAFGTGAHPTTRLCVELVAELPPAQLLDIGCGSGVISIAAALRGFADVTAVDVDPAAVDASERNAAANAVALDVRLLDALTQPLPPAAIVVANVSLEVVNALLSRVDAATIVCSGYLERDEPSLGRYRRLERRTLDGWAADLLERAE
ncbi:MAG: 50S ribosomal protein L11 methyltransferase [Gaiellaceae bacterium]